MCYCFVPTKHMDTTNKETRKMTRFRRSLWWSWFGAWRFPSFFTVASLKAPFPCRPAALPFRSVDPEALCLPVSFTCRFLPRVCPVVGQTRKAEGPVTAPQGSTVSLGRVLWGAHLGEHVTLWGQSVTVTPKRRLETRIVSCMARRPGDAAV